MAYRRIYENLETHLSVMIILFMVFFLFFFLGGGGSITSFHLWRHLWSDLYISCKFSERENWCNTQDCAWNIQGFTYWYNVLLDITKSIVIVYVETTCTWNVIYMYEQNLFYHFYFFLLYISSCLNNWSVFDSGNKESYGIKCNM